MAVVGGGSTYTPELVDGLCFESEPPDGGTDEGHDLVGERVRSVAGKGIAAGGGVEQHRGELEESVVRDGAGVDGGQHSLGVRQPEVRRDERAQRGVVAAAVIGAQGEPQRAYAEPGTSGGEVARELGEGREADTGTVGPHRCTIGPAAGPCSNDALAIREHPR